MYADVLVEINSKKIDKTFTYLVGDLELKVGQRVLVPFGNRKLEGFVLKIHNTSEDIKYKKIISVIDDHPVIDKEMLDLGKYISKKTLSPLITCYQTMLPSALKAKSKIKINKKYHTYLKVTDNNEPLTKKQLEYYNLIKNNHVLKKDIPSYMVKALKDKKMIEEVKEEVYRLNNNYEIKETNYKLTIDQKNVLENISLDSFKPYLIHGVTGSGKTLVYINLTKKVIKEGKDVIILVPEISLTPQMVKIFSSNFKDVAILHSGLSDGEKYDEWRKIEKGECHIAIGARSAIFAPFTNLGLIIIDEEHSETYKQENIPKYNTIDIALYRSKHYNIPLVLGSATPSIESYTRAKLGIYKLLEMKNRVNKNMPEISLVDMKEEFKKGNRVFSEESINKINDRLNKNEQIIILLNRRGYNTTITCKECGYVQKCPNCDIPLTYHKRTNSMVCHYCNHTEAKITECPNCHNKNVSSYGMGTERLCDLIEEEFKVKPLRMDQDTTSRKGSHEKILKAFGEHKYNILVGTQMIAKGLDFEDVTLVIVINADASLNIPDFRSSERTFELLSQVAGRSGRSSKKGEVIIQGFNLTHYSIECVKENDYQKFYNEEIKIRKILKYPPFYNLCYIKISGSNLDLVINESNKIDNYLKKKETNNIILGPSPSMMPKINNIYYYGIIIKYKKSRDVLNDLIFINNKYKTSKLNVQIDLSPQKI